MTSSLPNEPLWPRAGAGRQQRRREVVVEARRAGRPRSLGVRRAIRLAGRRSPAAASRRPKPRPPSLRHVQPPRPRPSPRRASEARSAAPPASAASAQPLDAGQDASLAIVEALLDVGREQEPAAGRAHAEGDGHRVVRLVADRHGDAAHPELLGAGRGAAVEADGRLAGRQPLDLDVAPADAPHAQARGPC